MADELASVELPTPKRQKLDDHLDNMEALPNEEPSDLSVDARENGCKKMDEEEDAAEGDERTVAEEEEVLEEGGAPLACFSKETDVGIEQYLSSAHKGFFAILKQRCVLRVLSAMASDYHSNAAEDINKGGREGGERGRTRGWVI